MFACIAKYLSPLNKEDSPVWIYQPSRFFLAVFFLFMPTLYEGAVPEVGADLKWIVTHWVSLFFSGALFIAWFKNTPVISMKFPIAVWGMIIFTIFLFLSFIDAYNPYKAWWFLKHWVSYSLIFFLVYALRHKDWYKGLLAVLIIPFTFNSIIGILHFFVVTDADIAAIFPLWEGVKFVDFFRQSAPPAATFANKNLAASYTVMMLPIALYALATWKHKLTQLFAAISFTLGSTFLIYTRSRGSWVAAIAAFIFLLIWVLSIKQNRILIKNLLSKYRIILLVLSLVITIFAAQFKSNIDAKYHSVGNTVSDQFSSISRMGKSDVGTRIAYLLNSMKIIADHPFNGIGLSNYQAIYPKYHRAFYETPKIGYAVEARPQRAHNDFVQAFVETGIIGGLAFLSIFLSTLYMGWKFAHSSAPESMRITSIFIVTSIGGIGVNALGDFPFQMPTAPTISWALIAILTGLYVIHFKEKSVVGFNIKLKVPSVVFAGVAVIFFVALNFVMKDDLARREASVHMKYAMSYSAARIFNDKVLDSLNKAYEIYPYNSRTMEYRGTIPVNYKGKRELSLDTLMKLGEDAIKYDPYAPNNLINLGGIYFRKAMQADKLGDAKALEEYTDKVLDIYRRLVPLAYFAPHTYSLAGYAYLLKEEANKAIVFFDKAINLGQNYSSAVTGQRLALKALRLEGHSENDIQIMRGLKSPSPFGENKSIFNKN